MEFRQALVNKLMELMEKDDKICILDADLSKPNGTSLLYKKYPDRCFNVGVAEANMIGIAAGLAAYGFKPIALSFAPFATRRVCDQIAVSVSYAKQNVKIIGTDPGVTAALNGGTHMTFEDIAIMRSIPKMVVLDIVDDVQIAQAIEQVLEYDGPVYIRMPRKTAQRVYDDEYKFELFKADVVTTGNDITVVAGGVMVAEAKKAVDRLKEEGIEVELISANTIKPLDCETILKSIKKTNHIVTVENHNVFGGLYSAVAEMVADKYPIHIDKIGINDQFGQVGSYKELLSEYHLTEQDIYDTIKKNLNK